MKIKKNDTIETYIVDLKQTKKIFVDYVDYDKGTLGYTVIIDKKFETKWAYIDECILVESR